ncbi:MAG: HAMP domain-containing histidine kinase [Muribaculaceae bacterium]|nr:HAMP domain-containing histidine kinase [Muribaculaceae bacterium]
MSIIRHFILFLMLSGSITAGAVNTHLVDSLKNELAMATELSDSMNLLYDIFDTAPRAEQHEILEQLWDVAHRLDDAPAQLEIIRHIANQPGYGGEQYQRDLDRIKDLPEGSDKVRTMLYIKVMRRTNLARSASDSTSRWRIPELITQIEDNDNEDTTVKQVELLFTLCAYLEQFSSSPLLSQYLDKLGELMVQLDGEMTHQPYMLQNLYLTQQALTYSSVGNHEQAVDADKRLLQHLDNLANRYENKGRKYRNLNYNKYVCYRRMLCNYKALTADEVEEYYSRLKELADEDPTLANEFYTLRLSDACHLMAQKKYHEALPILIKYLENPAPNDKPYISRQVVEMIIEAARAIGNKEVLLEALLRNRKTTEREQEILKNHQLRELQMLSEANDLKLQQQLQRNERLEHNVDKARTIRNYSILLAVTMIIFILVMFRMWRRTKSLNNDITKSNDKLTEERDILKHTQSELIKANDRIKKAEKKREEFINNMSHEISTPLNAITEYSQLLTDCADEEKRPYLKRFADIINLNADLILRLVNDVLEIASSDKNLLNIDSKQVAITNIATIAGDSFKHRLQPGVEFINNVKPDPSLIVNTDSKRVVQVLLNLLVNSAKFTDEGSITLDGSLSDDGNTYTFTITDTGIGIPPGKEEIIFERFEQLNSRSQGIGLGLAVCRLIATALGGEVYVDKTHKGRGARFIFRFPVK